MPEYGSAVVIIDYQNIHLSGHDCFASPGLPKHESLIHPLHFANKLVAVRNQVLTTLAMKGTPEARPLARLDRVVVFRGLPSNERDPRAYRRSQAQRSEWTRDRRTEVNYRTLRYHRGGGRWIAQEKGIDVLVALELVRAADRRSHDIVLVASHDTDLEPAIGAAIAGPVDSDVALKDSNGDRDVVLQPRPWVETAGWKGCKVLKVPGTRVWHTALDAAAFVASRDRKDYT